MTETNDGGPAFPHVAHENTVGIAEGATLRDYFAAAALTGLVASSKWNLDVEATAVDAYAIAGAMLAARDAWVESSAMLAERERAGGEG